MAGVLARVLSLPRPYVFGMIHVPALPGSPLSQLSTDEILKKVREETRIYAECEIDGLIVENMHDIPYVKPPAAPETIAAITLACAEVTRTLGNDRSKFLLGLQVLAACNEEALSIAHVTGFDLIRAECFVFSHVADEGWMDGCAGHLLRHRKKLGSNVGVITDIKKKHSAHSITSDVTIAETAKAAEFFLADGVIVTGSSTGQAASPEELNQVRNATQLPVFIGSGVTASNAHLFADAHAFIVGSEFKKKGQWQGDLDPDRIQRFMETVQQIDRSRIKN